MKKVGLTVSLGLAALMITACGIPVTNTSANANADTSRQPTAVPTADALLALDKQANEAYLKGDSKFFEGILSDKLVMHEEGHRMDKASVLKRIAGNKCDAKSVKLEEPQIVKIDADTYLLSYKATFNASCMGSDGKSTKVSSPTRAATVWVRSGDKWLVTYHGQNLIIDPKNPPPSAKFTNKKDDKVAAKPAADPTTGSLMTVEKSIWEAWKAKDAKKLEGLTTADLSFQNIFGAYFANKAETIRNWTGPYCDITTVSVTDGVATLISPTVAILTSKGTAKGICSGQELTNYRVYGTSVYVKDGGSWKQAFCLNRPLN